MLSSFKRASAPMAASPSGRNDSGRGMVAHYTVPVKPTPATPAAAATLVLLRDRPSGGFDVLLMQRHRASTFAAGDFVFPGGKIEPDDAPANAAAWCAGPDPGEAGRGRAPRHATPPAPPDWAGRMLQPVQ